MTPKGYDQFAGVKSQMGKFDDRYFDYLKTLVSPWQVTNTRIPDLNVFPCAIIQCRTVGTLTPSSNGNFSLQVLPFIYKGYNCFNGETTTPLTGARIVVDGQTYGVGSTNGPTFSVHNFADLDTTIAKYRTISFATRITYSSAALSATGKVACACVPPILNTNMQTYDQLSDYNYAASYAALDGLIQVWFPAGPESFFLWDSQSTPGFTAAPYLIVAGTGYLPTASLTVEIFQNIEIYSVSQIFTANKFEGKPDMFKLSHALSTVSRMNTEKKLTSNGNGHNGFWQKALSVGKTVLKEVGPPMLKMLTSLV